MDDIDFDMAHSRWELREHIKRYTVYTEPSRVKCDLCGISYDDDEIKYNTDGPTYCIYCTD